MSQKVVRGRIKVMMRISIWQLPIAKLLGTDDFPSRGARSSEITAKLCALSSDLQALI
jgi:hypothetical protein